MTFSKEDHAAWENSEIMRELEKLAGDVLDPSAEPYQPIAEKTWEDEDDDEQKLIDAADALLNENDDTFEKEMRIAHNERLISRLEKLAEQLADKSNKKAAYRVERTVQELKALLREEK